MSVYKNTIPRGLTRDDSNIAAEDFHIFNRATNNLKMQKEFRANFNPHGVQRFSIIESTRGRKLKNKRLIKGKVIFRSDFIVVIQLKYYKEAFTMANFFIKDITILDY